MGKVISSPSMSLDSFIDSPDYTVLSDWVRNRRRRGSHGIGGAFR
jgi:hypothetical protein